MTRDEMNAAVARGLAHMVNPFKELRAYMRAQTDDVLQELVRQARRLKGKATHMKLAQTELNSRTGRRLAPRAPSQWRTVSAAWLKRHGLQIGDMVDITNCAGRTFTGRLVDVRRVLGHIALDGDPRFAFSLFDAKVRKSRAKSPSTFVSRAAPREEEWPE